MYPFLSVRSVRKGKLVVVAGVNGVGKSTVLAKLREGGHLGTVPSIYNFGDVMLRLALERGWVEHRDQLRKLPLERQLALQSSAAESLASKARDENVLVDTHVLVPTRSGLWPGLPLWVVEGLVPDVIVLIEASPEVTLKHRQADLHRERRDQETPEEVKRFMEMNRAAAFASAVLVGAAVQIVQNVEGNPSVAADAIVKLFST